MEVFDVFEGLSLTGRPGNEVEISSMPALLFENGWLTATGGVVSEFALGGVLRTAVSVGWVGAALLTGSRTVGVRITVCSAGGDVFGAVVAVVVASGVLTASAAAAFCSSSDFGSA